MRDIKFRTWDKRTGKFIDNCVLFGSDGIAIDEDLLDWSFDWEADIEVMQFTGLKDKNGVEIYEGDIVRILYADWPSQSVDESGKYPMELEGYMDSISNIGKVVFKDCEFCIQFNADGYTNTIFSGPHGQIKVIGNIYENPELIGE